MIPSASSPWASASGCVPEIFQGKANQAVAAKITRNIPRRIATRAGVRFFVLYPDVGKFAAVRRVGQVRPTIRADGAGLIDGLLAFRTGKHSTKSYQVRMQVMLPSAFIK